MQIKIKLYWKSFGILILILVSYFGLELNFDNVQAKDSTTENYISNEILVKFDEAKVDLDNKKGIVKRASIGLFGGVDESTTIKSSNIIVYKIDDDSTVEEKIAELQKDESVERVQPNYIYEMASITTDDEYFPIQYVHENTGQMINHVNGIGDADMDTKEAWNIYDGSEEEVVVAVIDTGVNYRHPDLADKMWDGSDCVDLDGELIVGGCIHGGYDVGNASGGDIDPMPFFNQWQSHGTFVAGAIAATDNLIGVLGVNPNVKIMAIKTSYKDVNDNIVAVTSGSLIRGIEFAKNNNADLISMAAGKSGDLNDEYDYGLYEAIDSFDGLVIVPAGNKARNNDNEPYYPSSFNLDNIISVTATNQNDELAYFSSYGSTTVDVAAPGVDVYGTTIDNILIEENVQDAAVPDVPSDITVDGGNFGTIDIGEGEKVFVGDTTQPIYEANHTSKIISDSIDLSSITVDDDLFMDLWVYCDTEYVNDPNQDYMTLAFSKDDGVSFNIPYIAKKGVDAIFDEKVVGNLSGQSVENMNGGYGYHFRDMIEIEDTYKTSTFKWSLEWKTNANNNEYKGCYMDDIRIKTFSVDGEEYGYFRGTSMASAYVTGLTALAKSFRSDLSDSDIKNAVVTHGDYLGILDGKVKYAKRVNAFNTISSIIPPMTHFVVTGNDTQVAGDVQQVTITATNLVGRTHKSYVGEHDLIFSGAQNSQTSVVPSCTNINDDNVSFSTQTKLNFVDGVATCNMKLYNKESAEIEVDDGTYNSKDEDAYDLNVAVSPATVDLQASRIDVTPSPAIPGREVGISIITKDKYLNQLDGGNTVLIDISGTNAETPAVVDDNDGTYSAAYTPTATGNDAITATIDGVAIESDTDGVSDGTFNLVVQNPEMHHLTLTGDTNRQAGHSQEVTITAVNTIGEVYEDFLGDQAVIFSGANNAITGEIRTCTNKDAENIEFGSNTVLTFVDGIAKCEMMLYKKESVSIDVVSGSFDSNGDPLYDLDVSVSADVISAGNTYIEASPNPVLQKENVYIVIIAEDAYKNKLAGGGDNVDVKIAGSNTKTLSTTDNGNGQYTTKYAPINSGTDKITGTVNSSAIGSDMDGNNNGEFVLSVTSLPPPPPPPPPTFDFSHIDIKFDKKYISGRRDAIKKEVKFKFKDTEGVKFYKASTYEEFVNEEWRPISESPKLKIDSWNLEKGKKQRFYFKFKSENGVESEIEDKSVIYNPKVKRDIKQSSKKVHKGDILVQSGKRFKKNKEVNLYFSKPGGGYYPPMTIKTDHKGRFEVQYRVNKAYGEYTWYAQQISTGKKSEIKKYKVIQ